MSSWGRKKSHDLFREFFDSHSELKGNFDGFLKLGVANASPRILADLPSADQAILKMKDDFNLSGSSLEVLLVPDFHTWDGQFSNNGWMMECPHPITKLTWDNALLISPVLAKQLEKQYPDLGLLPKATMLNKNGEIAPDAAVFLDGKQKTPLVKLTVGDHHEITVPLYVQPGLADFTVISTIGQGRSRVGRVGSGTGFNSCSLMHTDANRVITGRRFNLPQNFIHSQMCRSTGRWRVGLLSGKPMQSIIPNMRILHRRWAPSLILLQCGVKTKMLQ